jgi:hypothetical protein
MVNRLYTLAMIAILCAGTLGLLRLTAAMG